MSPEEAKDLAAKYRALADLFAAKAEGKSLQLSCTKFSEGNGIAMWETTEYFPTPDSDLSKWRVKPEPRRILTTRDSDGILHEIRPENVDLWKTEGHTITEWKEVQP